MTDSILFQAKVTFVPTLALKYNLGCLALNIVNILVCDCST